MKAFLTFVLIVASLSGAEQANQATQETSHLLAWLQYLASELAAVRRELHEDRIEKQEARIQALERELQQYRAARRESEEQERMQGQELARIDQQLGGSSLSAEERAQLEGLRAELLARKPSAPADPGRFEAQAAERLGLEQRRLQKLREMAQAPASR